MGSELLDIDELLEEMGQKDYKIVSEVPQITDVLNEQNFSFLIRCLDFESLVSFIQASIYNIRLIRLIRIALERSSSWINKETDWKYRRRLSLYANNITRIKLGPTSELSVKLFEKGVEFFQCLKFVRLEKNKHIKCLVFLYTLPNLSTVVIEECPSLDFLSLSILMRKSTSLEEVSINNQEIPADFILEMSFSGWNGRQNGEDPCVFHSLVRWKNFHKRQYHSRLFSLPSPRN